MTKRLGFVGIMIEHREQSAGEVNRIISQFGDSVVARQGVPYKDRMCSVISLIVDMDTDELGSLTGRLGAVPGVSTKSALIKDHPQQTAEARGGSE